MKHSKCDVCSCRRLIKDRKSTKINTPIEFKNEDKVVKQGSDEEVLEEEGLDTER